MTVSTAVKWAVSSMTGAPTLNGTAGSMIAVLDAFLVNGFGTKAVDSAQVTSGVCRLAITGASAALDHSVIQLAGITGGGAALNGLQRVKTAAASYVEFLCDLPDGPLSGTITFKIAPLGWEKVFSKTNVAVYRSADPAGTRAYYRVDDTNALFARVQMYESMTDVDTGVAAALSVPAGGFYWHKRSAAAATGVYWVLSGDSRGISVSVAPNAGSTASSANGYGLYTHFMGDGNSYRSGDAWSAVLTGAPTATYTDLSGCMFCAAGTNGIVAQRGSSGLGGAVNCSRAVLGGSAAAVSGADSTLGAFPSRADNGLRIAAILFSDGPMASNGPRGQLPGLYHSPQSGVAGSYGGDVRFERGQASMAGMVLMAVPAGALGASATGVGFIDITGPWRGD